MRERREYERFDLKLPVRIQVLVPDGKKTFNALSTDISAGGVYIFPKRSFTMGTQVKLELTVLNARVKKLTGAQGLIMAEGTVVRCTSTGIAISFGEDCQVMSSTAREMNW